VQETAPITTAGAHTSITGSANCSSTSSAVLRNTAITATSAHNFITVAVQFLPALLLVPPVVDAPGNPKA